MYTCVLSRFSYVRLLATLWTVTHKAPISMGFSRQEHWSGLPCPPLRDFPNPEIEPELLTPYLVIHPVKGFGIVNKAEIGRPGMLQFMG